MPRLRQERASETLSHSTSLTFSTQARPNSSTYTIDIINIDRQLIQSFWSNKIV